MKTFAIACVSIVICVGSSCRKAGAGGNASAEAATGRHSQAGESTLSEERNSETGRKRARERADRLEFDKRIKSARGHFDQRDIQAALAELDKASEIFGMHPDVLNLRGSCQVELRDFDQALKNYTDAAKREPRNPGIQFNIGEVHFVAKQWPEALKVFKDLRAQMPPEAGNLGALIDFKILLCQDALGNSDEFARLAQVNQAAQDSPLSDFTKAALAFRRDDQEGAEELLADAARKFPDPNTLAPWKDTLTEYGWLHLAND